MQKTDDVRARDWKSKRGKAVAVNLEGKHLVGPHRTGTTVLSACIIQTSPLLYFTLPSLSHVNEPRHQGWLAGWLAGGEAGGLGEARESDKGGGETHWNKTDT